MHSVIGWPLLFLLAACDVSRPVRMYLDSGVTCPVLAAETATSVHADVECSPDFCTAAIRQTGCTFALETSCQPSSLEGTIAPDGTIGFDGCSGTPADGEPFLTVACAEPRCRIALYHPAPPAFDTLEIPIVSGEFRAPEGSAIQPLDQYDPIAGRISGMAVLGDRIAVVAHEDYRELECDPLIPSQIVFVDRATLALSPPVDAPACLRAIVQSGDGFAGLFAGPTLGLFDAAGQLVRSVPLATNTGRTYPIDLAIDGDRAHALVGGRGECRLFAFDAAWTVTATSAKLASRLRALAHGSLGTVLISDLPSGRISRFDPVTLAPIDQVYLFVESARKISDDAGRVLRLPGLPGVPGRFLISTTGTGGGLWVLSEASVDLDLTSALSFEREASPWAMIADGDRALVGMTTPDLAAYIGVFDPPSNRFVPGAARVGRGFLGVLAFDANGDLWATLPWSGSIARIRPR